MIGSHHTEEQWDQCPATMVRNQKSYIATVTKGKKKILQAPGSSVSLEIPEGNKGVYVMGVHTDHSDICRILEERECFVSPVVEVTHKTFDNEYASETSGLTINIPHCLSGKENLELVRVKRGDPSRSIPFQELRKADGFDLAEDMFSVDKNFVRIKTKKLSEFVCISCNTTCQAAIQVFLLGEFDQSRENNFSKVKVKSFLCSSLFKIADYRNVSLFVIHI